MAANVTEALRSHPFFRDFPDEDLTPVEKISEIVEYSEGEKIVETDKPADQFFLILEGDVLIEVESQEGGELPIQKISSGKILGWSWLIPPHDWEFDASASTDLTVVEIDGDKLRALCDENPDFRDRIKSQLLDVLAERVSAIRYLLLDIQQTTDEFQALTGG